MGRLINILIFALVILALVAYGMQPSPEFIAAEQAGEGEGFVYPDRYTVLCYSHLAPTHPWVAPLCRLLQ